MSNRFPLRVVIAVMHDVNPERLISSPTPVEIKGLVEFLTGQKVTGSLKKVVNEVRPKLRRHLPDIARGTVPPAPPADLFIWLIQKEREFGGELHLDPLP